MPSCPRCYAFVTPDSPRCPSCGTTLGAPTTRSHTPTTPPPRVVPWMAGAPQAPVPAPAGNIGGIAPIGPVPSVTLAPGERVLRTFTSDRAALTRIMRRNFGIFLGVMIAVIAPLGLLYLPVLSARGALLWFVVMGGVLALVAVPMGLGVRRAGSTPPARTTVTDRRILVEHFGKDATPSVMFLENVNRVELEQGATARKAGVQWVYVLPLGTDKAFIQAGRSRQVAPGVLWVPALPTAEAEALRDLVTRDIQAVRARMMGGPVGLPPPPPPPPI